MVNLPKDVTDQFEENERVVGYMETLFKEKLIFTKTNCSSKERCQNFLYHSEKKFKKENVLELEIQSLSKYEMFFVSAFLWDK